MENTERPLLSSGSPTPPYTAENIRFLLVVCFFFCVCVCFILQAWYIKLWVMKFNISSFRAQSSHQLSQEPQTTVVCHTFYLCVFLWILHTYLSLWTWHWFLTSYFRREWILYKDWERGKINSFWLDRRANDVFFSKEWTQGGPACCQHLWTSKTDFQPRFSEKQGTLQDLNLNFIRWKRRSF